jgi:hypothetical protein
MADTTDMSTPVTRGELRAELAPLATKAELAPLATKAELELWGGALLARIEQRINSLEQRLLTELARHTRAISESMSMQISAIDDRYTDLPRRVRRLEAKVFPPKRR